MIASPTKKKQNKNEKQKKHTDKTILVVKLAIYKMRTVDFFRIHYCLKLYLSNEIGSYSYIWFYFSASILTNGSAYSYVLQCQVTLIGREG